MIAGPAADAKVLLRKVDAAYSGARRSFIYARLCLRTGLDLDRLASGGQVDEKTLKILTEAIQDVCPEVSL